MRWYIASILSIAFLYGANCSSARSCEEIGIKYISGDGVKIDGYKAVEYLEKACSMGSASACNGAAFIFADAEGGVKQDYTKALDYWNRACRYGDSTACANYNLAQQKLQRAREKGTLTKTKSPHSHHAYHNNPLDSLK